MIGALALIIIGPKDLPIAMRKLGQFIGKMRGMAAEFRASFDELARQSELEELRKEVEALRVSRESLTSALNPLADSHVAATINEINAGLQHTSASPLMLGSYTAPPTGEPQVAPPEPPAIDPAQPAEAAAPITPAPKPLTDPPKAAGRKGVGAAPPKAAAKRPPKAGNPAA